MIRFYNGRTLTMTRGAAISADEVWTEDGLIAYVGPPKSEMPEFEREVDLRGDLLMPGFKNAHAHSAMTFLRSHADDLPLQSWLFEQVFPFEDKLTPEHIAAFTRLAIMEYLTSGITASFDMYFHRDACAETNINAGFRTVICGALTAGDDPQIVERDYKRFGSLHPLVSYQAGIHAEYTADIPLLKYMSELTHAYKLPFWSHNSETRLETEECRARHGKSPTALFESLGLYDYCGGGFHCVWLDDEDMEIFRRRNLWAVTCPGSNAKLASGIAPLARFSELGINLAIGTDGAGSNNALDMFREMYLACVLQKLAREDASACPADYILTAATSGSARAMGLADCDCIAPGKQADLIVLDMSCPNMHPVHNIPKNIVYSGSKENVRLTMVAGRILYENGEFHTGFDPERVYREAEAMTKEIFNAV